MVWPAVILYYAAVEHVRHACFATEICILVSLFQALELWVFCLGLEVLEKTVGNGGVYVGKRT